jgi:MerR family transcriptional regulator, copper efflux regulator
MNGYRISEVAERTGFAPSALRLYERVGLVAPSRAPSGYRAYADRDLESLRLVRRGKRLGLSLEEIRQLVRLQERDECAPLQARLRAVLPEKAAAAGRRIAELSAFAAELRRTEAGLTAHTPEGACDDRCGCRADPEPAAEPLTCTLAGPEAIRARVAEWRAAAAAATGQEAIPGGVRLRFPPGVAVEPLARLAAEEHACCGWMDFALGIAAAGVTLDVTGPERAAPTIEALLDPSP